jgi:hypothetical protein
LGLEDDNNLPKQRYQAGNLRDFSRNIVGRFRRVSLQEAVGLSNVGIAAIASPQEDFNRPASFITSKISMLKKNLKYIRN